MSIPKEPRQLMINLMYLVLTALLAMNVSNEILNAFKIVDKSINSSSTNISKKNVATIKNFEDALEDDKIKANPVKYKKVQDFLALAKQAVVIGDQMEKELLAYKQMIITKSGGMDPQNPALLLREDDLDAATNVMIEGDKKGVEMKGKLQKFMTELAALVPTGDEAMSLASKNESMEKLLPIDLTSEKSESNPDGDWSYANFHMVPAVGAVTIMDKYINDVKNSQSIVMDELWAKAFGEQRSQTIVFDTYDLMVSSPNTYLLPGEKIQVNAMLGAFNQNSKNLSIRAGGQNLAINKGIASFNTTASGKGEQKIVFSASFVDPNTQKPMSYTKEFKYYVGEAQASISLDKMNVFYIGVPNPITFSASGVPAGNIKYTSENCTLTPTPAAGVNKYEVNVTTPGAKAKITLSATLSDGTTKSFGTYEYRVKRIPDPYPSIANKRGGSIAVNELKAQQAIFAKLDNFDFDAKFVVTSYTVTYLPRRGDAMEAQSNSQYLTGPNANGPVNDILSKLKVGDKIFFENIKAVGPDKQTRSIGSIAFICNN
jgi:gliding motility-associated protein GldM